MDEVFRLAKPRKKGLLSLIFSRFCIFALLIALQVALYISFYGWLKTSLPYFSVLMTMFIVSGVVHLFNSGMDASAKLTWMLIIAVMPLTGAVLLFFTRKNWGHRTIKNRTDALIRQTRNAIPQPQGVLEALEGDGSGTDDLARYMNRSGCFPVYNNTEVTYFSTGEDKFAAML